VISLDGSRGSVELLRYFAPFGIPVRVANLVPIGGDAWFTGNGPHGDLNIVVERKRITDLIDSMKSNRLKGYQLPLMYKNYDMIYIIVEGIYRPGNNGQLEESRKVTRGGKVEYDWVATGTQYRSVDNFMTSLGPLCEQVKRAATPEETVYQIVDLYRYYMQPWNTHSQGRAVYSPEVNMVKPGGKLRHASVATKWVEKVAYVLPGIDKKTYDVGAKFKTIRKMVNATQAEWCTIPGVGKVTAANIQRALDTEGADL
jgi:ERCC4-type nuclease